MFGNHVNTKNADIFVSIALPAIRIQFLWQHARRLLFNEDTRRTDLPNFGLCGWEIKFRMHIAQICIYNAPFIPPKNQVAMRFVKFRLHLFPRNYVWWSYILIGRGSNEVVYLFYLWIRLPFQLWDIKNTFYKINCKHIKSSSTIKRCIVLSSW